MQLKNWVTKERSAPGTKYSSWVIASGVDSHPTNGIASSVSNTLQDPTQKNFIDILNQDLNSATSEGMTKQANLDRSLLTDLNQYQAPANAKTGGNLSTLA
jgi:hypothetical protein